MRRKRGPARAAAPRDAPRGATWAVDARHRLVRAEVDLRRGEIRCVALRLQDPTAQPTLAVLPYDYPRGDLTR